MEESTTFQNNFDGNQTWKFDRTMYQTAVILCVLKTLKTTTTATKSHIVIQINEAIKIPSLITNYE